MCNCQAGYLCSYHEQAIRCASQSRAASAIGLRMQQLASIYEAEAILKEARNQTPPTN